MIQKLVREDLDRELLIAKLVPRQPHCAAKVLLQLMDTQDPRRHARVPDAPSLAYTNGAIHLQMNTKPYTQCDGRQPNCPSAK